MTESRELLIPRAGLLYFRKVIEDDALRPRRRHRCGLLRRCLFHSRRSGVRPRCRSCRCLCFSYSLGSWRGLSLCHGSRRRRCSRWRKRRLILCRLATADQVQPPISRSREPCSRLSRARTPSLLQFLHNVTSGSLHVHTWYVHAYTVAKSSVRRYSAYVFYGLTRSLPCHAVIRYGMRRQECPCPIPQRGYAVCSPWQGHLSALSQSRKRCLLAWRVSLHCVRVIHHLVKHWAMASTA